MAQPQVYVHLNSLLTWARAWDEQSAAMGRIAAEIGGAQPSPAAAVLGNSGFSVAGSTGQSTDMAIGLALGDYPLFRAVLTAYEKAATEFGRYSGQGQQQMRDIADALVRAHRNYERTEQVNTNASNDIAF